jgi:hypothetical protein
MSDASPAPAKAAPKAAVSPAERVDTFVNQWFVENVQNTPIALEQRAYVAAMAARDALKVMLLENFV